MNIAYVCADRGIPFLGGKGASVHMREMARALRAGGHRVLVACVRIGGGNPAPDVRLVSLADDAAAQAHYLTALLREAEIDIVLERYALESGAARLASAALGIPLILEVNAPIVLEAARYRGLLDVERGLDIEREVFASADAAAVVSRALGAYVTAAAPELVVRWVPNGVDASRFDRAVPGPFGLDPGAVGIGFVGSMKPWHGVHDLLDAFEIVSASSPEAHLVLAGEGPEEDLLRARVASGAFRGRATLMGGLPHGEVPGLLAALHIGVAPYRGSADFYFSPLKVLEYMAAGLPVVHPSIGDLPDTVAEAGLAYPADDVPALAAALARLTTDAYLRRELGEAARRRAGRYSWDAAAGQIEALIEATMARFRHEVRR